NNSVIFNFSGYLCLLNEKKIVSKKKTKMGGACTFIYFQKQLVPRGTNCRGWWSCLKLSQISVSTHTVPYHPNVPPPPVHTIVLKNITEYVCKSGTKKLQNINTRVVAKYDKIFIQEWLQNMTVYSY
ncbi:unnamed protein product, partial [Meganyctiphanes norvegica]